METNPMIPFGSYLLTSQYVTISVNAQCYQINGELVQSPTLVYQVAEAAVLSGIWNNNGVLQLVLGTPLSAVPTFVPQSSYLESSTNVEITINALCYQENGSLVQSPPFTYTTAQAGSFSDIANMNGILTAVN